MCKKMECGNCKKVYEYGTTICPDCNVELTEIVNVEEVMNTDTNVPTTLQIVENTETEENNVNFCEYCGNQIGVGKEYCSNCGRSTISPEIRHCTNCGNILNKKQKFCNKCGNKVSIIVSPKVKKKFSKKKIIIVSIIVILVATLASTALYVAPNIFVSTEKLLEQGNYEEAYLKAKDEEKLTIITENIVAVLCKEAKDGLKNSDSFSLRDIFILDNSNEIVLHIQGTNSYGGTVTNYWYYKYYDDDKEYKLYDTVSDFDEEEVYSWDDAYDKIEKRLNNATKKTIKEIVQNKDNKIDSTVVKRINNLNDEGLLDDVELIEQTDDSFSKKSDKK